MLKHKNLILVGTSHIAKSSVKEVKEVIEKEEPDLIAVELDRRRLYALLHQRKSSASILDIKYIGLTGYIFTKIGGWAQKKLGGMVGMMPGSEMLTAVKLSRKHKILLALIDQDIEKTLRKFTRKLTLREKFRFIGDIFRGLIFPKSELRKFGIDPKKFDLRKVPPKDIINKLTGQLKKRYPNVYEVLIKDRNEVMGKRLFELMKNHKKIVAVVGAGHEEEIIDIIKKQKDSTEYSFVIS